MDRLILVRHGETASNARGLMNPDSELDAPLSADGEAAAMRLARELAPEPIDLVVTSPRLRARRTAEVVAGTRGLEVRDVDDLAEIRAGSFEAGPVAAFQEWVLGAPPDVSAPGGESVQAAARRYVAAVRVIQADSARLIVAVTHNLPMRMLVNAASGADPLTGPLRRVPQATPHELGAAELATAIAALDTWIDACGTTGARPRPGPGPRGSAAPGEAGDSP